MFGGPIAPQPLAESKWWTSSTVAVVTGANKGIGYEIAYLLADQGLSVVLTSRSEELGTAAVQKLKADLPSSTVSYCQLDITDPASVEACSRKIKQDFGKVSILVNNAGIAYKGSTFGADEAATTIACNLTGTRRVCEALLPQIKESREGRIVNVCSRDGRLGQLSSQELKDAFLAPVDADALAATADSFVASIRDGTYRQKGWSSSMYGVSKVAEISYTKLLARELADQGISVYACCPGYCVTDMTSGGGNKTAREGADTPAWLALQPLGSIPSGGFFGERTELNW